jgi:hypothetical protein
MNEAQTNSQEFPYRILMGRILAGLIICILPIRGMTQDNAGDPAQRGAELAKRVLQKQNTSGFLIRARALVGENPEDPALSSVLQVRIVGRREKSKTQVLYQILWPTSRIGTALVLDLGPQSKISGFLFTPPDHLTPITDSLITTPFAGTAMTIEDLAENYWHWPSQRIVGPGRAGERRCTILESRPPPETTSAYSSRTKTEQTSRIAMVVEGNDKSQRTRVEFLKSERDLKISPDEFSVERLKSLTVAKP